MFVFEGTARGDTPRGTRKTLAGERLTYIDTGYWQVSAAAAKRLAGRLPRPGWELQFMVEGQGYWLCRTVDNGRRVWALRRATGRPPVAR